MIEHIFPIPESDKSMCIPSGWDCRFSVRMDCFSQKLLNNFAILSYELVETGF
jgi:hypothetical protein